MNENNYGKLKEKREQVVEKEKRTRRDVEKTSV